MAKLRSKSTKNKNALIAISPFKIFSQMENRADQLSNLLQDGLASGIDKAMEEKISIKLDAQMEKNIEYRKMLKI